MPIPNEALELENQWVNQMNPGKPTLGIVFNILKQEWLNNNRDRELGLHLLFLAWYGLVEPAFITGFETREDTKYILRDGLTEELQLIFRQVHDYFEPMLYEDPEMLYVVGLMANIFPYVLGNSDEWENRSVEYRKRHRKLLPNGVPPDVFKDRGAYGEYFYGHAKNKNGY